MEDIIQALLDVVRIQHGEADGTEVEPFNMEDIIDMAMNIVGRPEEEGEEKALIKEIEGTVERITPDLFPPKTFDQLDDQEQVASAASMIEQSLLSGMRRQSISNGLDSGRGEGADQSEDPAQNAEVLSQIEAYNRMERGDEADEDDFDAGEAADLNNMIYDNIMKMMGLTEPRLEDAFDRSQIRFGREKSITEQLEEEQRNASMQDEKEEPARPLSAWELAQNAIDKDIEAHSREEYVPKPMEIPNTKSASQLAAEAIERMKAEDDKRSEIEKRAEAMMEEARRLGKDPMQFALHQQEILRYMEKNSDELVSFEDYEDLTPEEKYEIERAIEEEKRKESGQADAPDNDSVPVDAPSSDPASDETGDSQTTDSPAEAERPEGRKEESGAMPILSEEMLRQLSQEVIRENSDQILADNADEDMDSLNEAIMENIRKMMGGAGVPVHQESVDSLIDQVISGTGGGGSPQRQAEPDEAGGISRKQAEADDARGQEAQGSGQTPSEERRQGPVSAADLARAAQDAAGIRREEEIEETTVSAVELAKIAQEAARRLKEAEETEAAGGVNLTEADLDFDSLDFDLDDDGTESETAAEGTEQAVGKDTAGENDEPARDPAKVTDETEAVEGEDSEATAGEGDQAESDSEEAADGRDQAKSDAKEAADEGDQAKSDPEKAADDEDQTDSDPEGGDRESAAEASPEGTGELDDDRAETEPEEDAEQDQTDVEVFVLGEHTQSEIDEALRNLETLGLEGDVYKRAERLLLLEMAGSEAELDAWLAARDTSEPIPEASPLYEDMDDLTDLDAEEIDKELEIVLDEEFAETEDDEEPDSDKEEDSMEADSDEADSDESPESTDDSALDGEIKAEDEGAADKVRAEKTGEKEEEGIREPEQNEGEQNKELQVSIRNPFILKNSASYMDEFEDFIVETQENRRLSTGFHKLDTLLRYGLHKGSYFIDSDPQYLKNAFIQQIADRTAENSIDVLFISTELSRYDLMVESVSRLSYEIHSKDGSRAVSPMDIMSGREGANLIDLKDELNWYRGRISEHLFIVDQEAVQEMADSAEEGTAGMILEDLIRSIVREGAHKPVVVIDNLENVLASEDPEDMKPLMAGMKKLASELGIPILMTYGYAQAESDMPVDEAEKEFRRSLGNMCDVYLDLKYADMITEDGNSLTREDIRDMAENGETVLIDVAIRRNRRVMRASCQIQSAPKFNWFTE